MELRDQRVWGTTSKNLLESAVPPHPETRGGGQHHRGGHGLVLVGYVMSLTLMIQRWEPIARQPAAGFHNH